MIIPTQYVSATANNVAIGAVDVNDLILVFAYFAGTATIPTLAGGFTSLVSQAGTAQGFNCGYKFAAGGEVSSGTWTNATQVVCMVYRNVLGFGATPVANAGNGTTLNYSAVTLQVADGTSWVVGLAGASSATAGMGGPTNGSLVSRTSQIKANGLDAAQVRAFTAQTMSVTTTGRWLTITVELKAKVDPVVGGNLAGGIV